MYEEVDSTPSLQGTERPKLSLVRKKIEVKRRFREFVNLQYRLEDNPKLKQYIINLKRPSNLRLFIPSMPFAKIKQHNLDKNIIEFRRKFLENFLSVLCNIGPICESIELQDFLGYRNNSSVAVLNSANPLLRPLRFDKMFVRLIRDALTFIKTALPPDSPQEGIYAPGPSLIISDSPEVSLKLMKTTYDCPSKYNQLLLMVTVQESKLFKSNQDTKSESNSPVSLNSQTVCGYEQPLVNDSSDNESASRQATTRESSQNSPDDIPLTSQVLNILWIHVFNQVTIWYYILLFVKRFLGQTVEK